MLERLAATEEMFKAPVSTIRDVAELTEASPELIARLLGEIRGPSVLEELIKKVDGHENRIQSIELTAQPSLVSGILQNSYNESYHQYLQDHHDSVRESVDENHIDLWLIFGILAVVLIVTGTFFAPLITHR